jgi:hypothetical protein
LVAFILSRTVDIFNQKMDGDDDESDQEDEDRDPKDPRKIHKKKKYATPVAEFIDVAREKLKIVVREFKF